MLLTIAASACKQMAVSLVIGQQYNKDGNRVQWWTDESIEEFKERTQCFVDQYDQYTLQGYHVRKNETNSHFIMYLQLVCRLMVDSHSERTLLIMEVSILHSKRTGM